MAFSVTLSIAFTLLINLLCKASGFVTVFLHIFRPSLDYIKKTVLFILTFFPAKHVALDCPAIFADHLFSNPKTVFDVHQAKQNAPYHSLHMQDVVLIGSDHR